MREIEPRTGIRWLDAIENQPIEITKAALCVTGSSRFAPLALTRRFHGDAKVAIILRMMNCGTREIRPPTK